RPELTAEVLTMSYISTLCAADIERYEEKLSVVHHDSGLQLLDIFQIPDEWWRDDLASWPAIEFSQVYTYLIETPGPFTREKLKAYRSLEAFNYYI
uniref:Uncharacterized protein n=1 Tax=Amphimedon queenslandica TaxID=400682 RepID=A0A1X7T104_AMPQE